MFHQVSAVISRYPWSMELIWKLLRWIRVKTTTIILGYLKTTSSNDLLTDLNLTSLHLHREIPLPRFFSFIAVDDFL